MVDNGSDSGKEEEDAIVNPIGIVIDDENREKDISSYTEESCGEKRYKSDDPILLYFDDSIKECK